MYQRKVMVYVFSDNQEKIDYLLRQYMSLFNGQIKKSNKSQGHIEYCSDSTDVSVYFRKPTQAIRGHKCDMVFIDENWKEELEKDPHYRAILGCMLVPQVLPIDVQYF